MELDGAGGGTTGVSLGNTSVRRYSVNRDNTGASRLFNSFRFAGSTMPNPDAMSSAGKGLCSCPVRTYTHTGCKKLNNKGQNQSGQVGCHVRVPKQQRAVEAAVG